MIVPLLPVLISAAMSAAAPPCAACTCVPPGDGPVAEQVERAAEAADAVFLGRVVRVDRPGAGTLPRREATSGDGVGVTLVVEKRWKGAVGDSALVVTSSRSSMCGVELVEGERYLVYAWSTSRGELRTGSCSRTAPVGAAEADLDVLAELRRSGALRADGETAR